MSKSSDEAGLAAALPLATILLGVVVLVLGFLWPALRGSAGALSDEQASEFYAASAELHSEAVKSDRSNRNTRIDNREPANESLQSAHERYAIAKQRVEAARQGSQRTSFWLKLTGGLLALAGCVGHYAKSVS